MGIDFCQRLTPLNHITASSETGLAGTVKINTSGIDPTRGLKALTEERINAEVAQGCQIGSSGEKTLSFYNLRRGGVPPSLDDLLNLKIPEKICKKSVKDKLLVNFLSFMLAIIFYSCLE